MNKGGQFFLILIVIIISVVAGLASVVNFVEKKSDAKFYYSKDELNFESGKAIDRAINKNLNMKDTLTDFAQDYSEYSNADDFYYIFGTTTEMTFAGWRKKSDGIIKVNVGSGDQEITLNKDTFKTTPPPILAPSGTNVKLIIDGVEYPFTLNQGQNFFFVVSKEVEGDVYTITNG